MNVARSSFESLRASSRLLQHQVLILTWMEMHRTRGVHGPRGTNLNA